MCCEYSNAAARDVWKSDCPTRKKIPASRQGLSARGFGTAQRTDPVYLGLQKTRLHDPTLNFFGTNDHPGIIVHRMHSLSCDLCQRSRPEHSTFYSSSGNLGLSQSLDTSIPKNESAIHPTSVDQPHSDFAVHGLSHGTGENMVASYWV